MANHAHFRNIAAGWLVGLAAFIVPIGFGYFLLPRVYEAVAQVKVEKEPESCITRQLEMTRLETELQDIGLKLSAAGQTSKDALQARRKLLLKCLQAERERPFLAPVEIIAFAQPPTRPCLPNPAAIVLLLVLGSLSALITVTFFTRR